MTIHKPTDLIRFISNIPVLNDGTVPVSTLDSRETFVSTLYDANYILSSLARFTQDDLNSGKIGVDTQPLDPNTIVSLALNSDLASYAPEIYLLLRVVVLEAFALLYNIEEQNGNLRYVSTKDILVSKGNISYIADYFGTEPKYYKMVEALRSMHVSLGYLQNQVEIILNNRGVR